MKRQDSALIAAVLGALLVAAGTVGVESTALVALVGAAAAVAGLVSMGTRGSAALMTVGAWLVISGLMDVAVTTWNLLLGGLMVASLGFLVGAVGTSVEVASSLPGEE